MKHVQYGRKSRRMRIGKSKHTLAVREKHLYAPTHGVYLVGAHESKAQVCCKKHFPSLLFAPLAEEEPYGTFSQHNFNFCIMTTVASAVLYLFFCLKFGDDGLGGQFASTRGRILGVTHFSHAKKMEFLVVAINEFNKFGTCKPTVYQ